MQSYILNICYGNNNGGTCSRCALFIKMTAMIEKMSCYQKGGLPVVPPSHNTNFDSDSEDHNALDPKLLFFPIRLSHTHELKILYIKTT